MDLISSPTNNNHQNQNQQQQSHSSLLNASSSSSIAAVIEKVIEVAQICEPALVAAVRSPELAHGCASKLPAHERLSSLVFIRDLYSVLGETYSSVTASGPENKNNKVVNNKNNGSNNGKQQQYLSPVSAAAADPVSNSNNANNTASVTPRAKSEESPSPMMKSPASASLLMMSPNSGAAIINNNTASSSILFTKFKQALCGQVNKSCAADQDEPFGISRLISRGLCHGDTEPLRNLLKSSPPLLKFFVQNLLASDPKFDMKSDTTIQREFLRELHSNPKKSHIFGRAFDSDSDDENNELIKVDEINHNRGRTRTGRRVATRSTRITLARLLLYSQQIAPRLTKATQHEGPLASSSSAQPVKQNKSHPTSSMVSPRNNDITTSPRQQHQNDNDNIENNNNIVITTDQDGSDQHQQNQTNRDHHHQHSEEIDEAEIFFNQMNQEPVFDFLREYPQFASLSELRITPRDALFSLNTLWCLSHPCVADDVHYFVCSEDDDIDKSQNLEEETEISHNNNNKSRYAGSLLENEGYHLWQEQSQYENYERSVAKAQADAAATYSSDTQHPPHLKSVIRDPQVLEIATKLSAERPLEDRVRFLLEINLSLQKKVPESCWRGMFKVLDKTNNTIRKTRPLFQGAALQKDKLASSCEIATDRALNKTPIPTPSLKPWEVGIRIGDYLTNVLQQFVFVCDEHQCHEMLSGAGDPANESDVQMSFRQVVAVIKWAVREVQKLTDEAEKFGKEEKKESSS